MVVSFIGGGSQSTSAEYSYSCCLLASSLLFLEKKLYIFYNKVFTISNKVRFMVFNATFNNISVISWWSVLLVEEARVPRKNHDLPQVTDNLYF
jgi:hypothetical protein